MVGERAPEAPRRGTAREPSSSGRPSWRRMHWRPGAGGPAVARRLLPLAAAVVLLALVAVGSLRRPPGSDAGTPRFPSALLQSLGLLAAMAAMVALFLAVWTMLPGKSKLPQRRRHPLFMPMVLLGSVLLLALLRRLGWLDRLGLADLHQPPAPTSPGAAPTSPQGQLAGGEPGWVAFVVVGLLLAGLAAAILVRGELARRRRAAMADPSQRLVELLEVTLADLEDERDPRRAVIAAWVRMERGFAAAGLPRRAAEAPLEYVARVLEAANVRPASIERLAELFERAKFSQHPIDEGMRAAAIEAVTTIRAELDTELARAAEEAHAAWRAGDRDLAERGGTAARR
jgi:Domain of unknown function (DUF4129)